MVVAAAAAAAAAVAVAVLVLVLVLVAGCWLLVAKPVLRAQEQRSCAMAAAWR